jgi:hypothetical protein
MWGFSLFSHFGLVFFTTLLVRKCGLNPYDEYPYKNLETKHIMLLECPRWACHRRHFGTQAQEFNGLYVNSCTFATSPKDIVALLLGGVPLSLHRAIYFTGNGRFFK